MISAKKISTLSVLGLIASLALTGCSGGGSTSSGGNDSGGKKSGSVFEFQTNGIEPSDEVTIQLPDDLRKAMGSEADGLVVEKIVAKGHELDGVKHCAVDLSITYGKGQPDAIIKANSAESKRAEKETDLTQAMDVSSLDEAAAKLDEVINASTKESGSPRDAMLNLRREAGHDIGSLYQPGDTGKALLERYLGQGDAAKTPDEETVAEGIGLGDDSVHPSSELDDSAPESGTYVSDDHKTITEVDDCAASATDPDNAIEMILKSLDAEGEIQHLADVNLSVMTDGTIGVSGTVDDYMRDANDNWIAS